MNLSTYHRMSCGIFHNLGEVQTPVEGTLLSHGVGYIACFVYQSMPDEMPAACHIRIAPSVDSRFAYQNYKSYKANNIMKGCEGRREALM